MLLGADPEIFLADATGKAVSAAVLFPGGKESKKTLYSDDPYGIYVKGFRDGYAVELNINPASCIASATEVMRAGLLALEKLAAEQELVLAPWPSVRVDLEPLLKTGDPTMFQFGCDPALNAYTRGPCYINLDGASHPFRYAGGHIHFSPDPDPATGRSPAWITDPAACYRAVRMLDLFLGLPMAAIFSAPEAFRRRQYYGKAGEFRMQDYGGPPYATYGRDEYRYGLEYRVLGPEVLAHHAWLSLAWALGRSVLSCFEDLYKKCWKDGMESELQMAINTGRNWKKLFQPSTFLPTVEVVEALRAKALFKYEFTKFTGSTYVNWPEIPHRWGVPGIQGAPYNTSVSPRWKAFPQLNS